MAPPTAVPALFTQAVASLRSVRMRPEIELEEAPAPQRLAPFAHAVNASVVRDDDEIAAGRLILLHDPAGHEAWQGTLRLVTYVNATLEPEMGTDPLLPAVGWSWLTDALTEQGARATAIGGTVTQTFSTRFGVLAGPLPDAEIEFRASWTALDADLDRHQLAWTTLIASTAGLPPPGVAQLPDRDHRTAQGS
jgi:hypothetical protein